MKGMSAIAMHSTDSSGLDCLVFHHKSQPVKLGSAMVCELSFTCAE